MRMEGLVEIMEMLQEMPEKVALVGLEIQLLEVPDWIILKVMEEMGEMEVIAQGREEREQLPAVTIQQ